MKNKHAMMFAALAASFVCTGQADPVPAELFGQNIEHTRSAVQGGLSAQLLRNRKFAGKPARCGAAQMWEAYGTRAVYEHLEGSSLCRHAKRNAMPRRNERRTQRIGGLDPAGEAGIAQDKVPLRAGVEHVFRAVFATPRKEGATVVLRIEAAGKVLAEREFDIKSANPSDWKRVSLAFTPAANVFATVKAGVKGRALADLGAVSLMAADNFRGMRPDVIENLRDIGTSIVRWPGGNFAGEYRWRDGFIADPDERAPIQSYTEIETQPHTLGYDSNDLGTEDILALCDKLGAQPFFTINPVWESPEDAADWVKACKGRVKLWSLGNEMSHGHMEGPRSPEQYAKYIKPYADAMLEADPSITLVVSCPWDNVLDRWAKNVVAPLSGASKVVSYHAYDSPGTFDFTTPESIEALFAGVSRSIDHRFKRLALFRKALPRDIAISYDEWNIWYSWFREDGIVEGIYGAGMLHGMMKNWKKLGLKASCYFQPINEHAIDAGPFASRLTSIGEAMRIMKGHVGGEPVKIDNLPAGAFATDAPDGSRYMTFYNTSTREPAKFRLPAGGRNAIAGGETLVPDGFEAGCRYARRPVSAKLDGDFCEIVLPPAHIASVKLATPKEN